MSLEFTLKNKRDKKPTIASINQHKSTRTSDTNQSSHIFVPTPTVVGSTLEDAELLVRSALAEIRSYRDLLLGSPNHESNGRPQETNVAPLSPVMYYNESIKNISEALVRAAQNMLLMESSALVVTKELKMGCETARSLLIFTRVIIESSTALDDITSQCSHMFLDTSRKTSNLLLEEIESCQLHICTQSKEPSHVSELKTIEMKLNTLVTQYQSILKDLSVAHSVPQWEVIAGMLPILWRSCLLRHYIDLVHTDAGTDTQAVLHNMVQESELWYKRWTEINKQVFLTQYTSEYHAKMKADNAQSRIAASEHFVLGVIDLAYKSAQESIEKSQLRINNIVHPQFVSLMKNLENIKEGQNKWNADWANIVINLLSNMPCIFRNKNNNK